MNNIGCFKLRIKVISVLLSFFLIANNTYSLEAGEKLIVASLWYNTILFKCFVGLLLNGGIGLILLQRVVKFKKKKISHGEFTQKLLDSLENERKRMASELHDSLGQNLMVIKNKLLFAKNYKEETTILSAIDEISNLISIVIDEVRTISHNLRPYELERLGLTEAILTIIENINATRILKVNYEVNNIDNVLSSDLEIHYYRIIQECMSNILKHSKANFAEIRIIQTIDSIETIIKDNGISFNLEKILDFKNGMGITGIKERVNLLNGTLKIQSEINCGTDIRVTIPL